MFSLLQYQQQRGSDFLGAKNVNAFDSVFLFSLKASASNLCFVELSKYFITKSKSLITNLEASLFQINNDIFNFVSKPAKLSPETIRNTYR
jgi:hypothetical protein